MEKAVKQLKDKGHQVFGVKCDVTNEEEIKSALDQTYEHFGSVDILINNAGMQHVGPIEEFSTEKYELLLKIMLIAPFMAKKHVFPLMKKNGFGRILNMASINGLIGFAGKAGYNSAKHEVVGLTKVAALEGAEHGITVNALCPGYVEKSVNIPLEKALELVIYPLVPQKRLLSVDEIADYALFLAGDKAKGVTGQAVVMDGGYTAQ
ncbi:3-hydroxybutyrate dehydrogenase [Sutcliffiella horikoshii]|uniref:3-hydroxybutyrate dehydrogenase n=1 Tax=Sutcliffiella horikoshii TaxID=79883 RepID=A0A5D4SYI0_9BACI|nr:3-hydroxybutyrate dehydrogenase [Sutcliffiella horikoshii]